MADKVYPVYDEPSAPRAHDIHSRTPTSASSVIIPIPEKAIRKEQEQTLIGSRSSFESTSTTDQFVINTGNIKDSRQKDFIYQTPVPLPPNHPSYRAASRSRRSRCCCCCAWICGLLALLLVVLGAGALIAYLVLQPKTPDFTVTDATITTFELTPSSNSSPPTLSSDVTLMALGKNPNTKIGIHYDSTDVALAFQGTRIGTGSIPAFYQGPKNTTTLALHMMGQDVSLTPAIGSILQTSMANSSSTIPLEASINTTVRIQVGGWASGASTIDVDCSIEISNPVVGNARLLSKDCSFKLKSFKLW